MDIPPVPNQPKTFKFPLRSFDQKNPVKRSFQSSQIERGYITMGQTTSRIVMHAWYAYRDGKLNSSNLDKRIFQLERW